MLLAEIELQVCAIGRQDQMLTVEASKSGLPEEMPLAIFRLKLKENCNIFDKYLLRVETSEKEADTLWVNSLKSTRKNGVLVFASCGSDGNLNAKRVWFFVTPNLLSNCVINQTLYVTIERMD